jgi:multiple sugar transport system substrate-binding protein
MKKRVWSTGVILFVLTAFLLTGSLGLYVPTAEAQSFEDLLKRINWQRGMVERVTKPSTTPKVAGERSGVRDGIPYSTELESETPGWTPPEGWEIVKTEGKVDKITWINPGGLEYDPATVANQKTFEKITGIKVENVVVPDAALVQKNITTFQAKSDAIDFVFASLLAMPDYMRNKWVEQVDFLWTDELAGKYNEAAVDITKYKGHYYGVPLMGRVTQFMYRKDLFREALGHDRPPQTWQEIIDFAQKLHKVDDRGNVIRYGFGFFNGRVGVDIQFHNLLFSQGLTQADILNEEGVPQYNTPYGVRALQFLVDLVQKYKVVPKAVGTYGDTDVYQMFISDKAALINVHSWANFKITTDLKAGKADAQAAKNWGVFVWPKCGGWGGGPEGVSVARIESHMAAINRFANPWKKLAAALYLDYVRSYYAHKYEAAFEQNPTMLKTIYDDPWVKQNVVAYDLIQEAIRDGQLITFWQLNSVRDVMLNYFNKAIAGKMTVKAALDAAQEEIEELITGF